MSEANWVGVALGVNTMAATERKRSTHDAIRLCSVQLNVPRNLNSVRVLAYDHP